MQNYGHSGQSVAIAPAAERLAFTISNPVLGPASDMMTSDSDGVFETGGLMQHTPSPMFSVHPSPQPVISPLGTSNKRPLLTTAMTASGSGSSSGAGMFSGQSVLDPMSDRFAEPLSTAISAIGLGGPSSSTGGGGPQAKTQNAKAASKRAPTRRRRSTTSSNLSLPRGVGAAGGKPSGVLTHAAGSVAMGGMSGAMDDGSRRATRLDVSGLPPTSGSARSAPITGSPDGGSMSGDTQGGPRDPSDAADIGLDSQHQPQQQHYLEPRPQEVLDPDDVYTPRWVRLEGHKKEGLCQMCPSPGRWLQLKNSAYWYHKQFTHGISSVSCRPFTPPTSIRVVWETTATNRHVAQRRETGENGYQTIACSSTHLIVEGRCGTCHQWIQLSNAKRRMCTLQGTVDAITTILLSHQPEGARPPILVKQHEQMTHVAAAQYENGEISIPPFMASVQQTLIDSISDVDLQRGGTSTWYRHAAKCHDLRRAPRDLVDPMPDLGAANGGHGDNL
nr:hypothetical protein HK105_002584 [Polyrhizophydium stewartii]